MATDSMEVSISEIKPFTEALTAITASDDQSSNIALGTAVSVGADYVSVYVGQSTTVNQAVRACEVMTGNRVVLLINDTMWICIAVIGGCPHGIGDIIHTENAIHPSTRWPGTSWVAVQGKTLFGYNTGEAEFNAIGGTGGVKTVSLTTAQMPSHSGHVPTSASGGNAYGRYLATTSMTSYGSSGRGWQEVSNGEALPVGTSLGNGEAHNNMPPYVTVYMWKRTA